MSRNHAKFLTSPGLVGLSAWIIPGAGYFLLGQRQRALTVCLGIVGLFFAGIIIGGIRIMDPPGWGQYGYMAEVVQRFDSRHQRYEAAYTRVEPSSAEQARDPRNNAQDRMIGSALFTSPVVEISDKPWFVGQILCGPMTLAASAASISAAQPLTNSPTPQEHIPASHSRSWEIGALYTAVAGMLNLLVIIDSTYRAGQENSPK